MGIHTTLWSSGLPFEKKSENKKVVPIKKSKKNGKSTRQKRWLAGAIALGLCLGWWGYNPAYAADVPEGTVVEGQILITPNSRLSEGRPITQR